MKMISRQKKFDFPVGPTAHKYSVYSRSFVLFSMSTKSRCFSRQIVFIYSGCFSRKCSFQKSDNYYEDDIKKKNRD